MPEAPRETRTASPGNFDPTTGVIAPAAVDPVPGGQAFADPADPFETPRFQSVNPQGQLIRPFGFQQDSATGRGMGQYLPVQARGAPDFFDMALQRGFLGIDPGTAQIMEWQAIEDARRANQQRWHGEGGLLSIMRGGLDSPDLQMSRDALAQALAQFGQGGVWDQLGLANMDRGSLTKRSLENQAAATAASQGRDRDYGLMQAIAQAGQAQQQMATQAAQAEAAALSQVAPAVAQGYGAIAAQQQQAMDQYGRYEAAMPVTAPSWELGMHPIDPEGWGVIGGPFVNSEWGRSVWDRHVRDPSTNTRISHPWGWDSNSLSDGITNQQDLLAQLAAIRGLA